MRRTRALSLGPFAERFLRAHATARVSAVFARSLHLEAEGEAMCVVDASLGAGALNAVVESFALLSRAEAGARCRAGDGALTIDGAGEVDCSTAAPWRPKAIVASAGWRDALAEFATQSLARAPSQGAFRAALDPAFDASDAVTRALRDRSAALVDWLALADGGLAAPPVAGLVGLGGGLTPAGDDLVGGAMIALSAAGRTARAILLGAAVEALGADATTILSRSMLRAAAAGVGGAALHEALAAIGAADARRAAMSLEAIDRIGHTSGWDALAGALLALRSA